jgi:hypothetical protein
MVKATPRGRPSAYSSYAEGLAVGVLRARKPYEAATCPSYAEGLAVGVLRARKPYEATTCPYTPRVLPSA